MINKTEDDPDNEPVSTNNDFDKGIEGIGDEVWIELKILFGSGKLERFINRTKKVIDDCIRNEKEKRVLQMYLADAFLAKKNLKEAKTILLDVQNLVNDKSVRFFLSKVAMQENEHVTGVKLLKKNINVNPFSPLEHYHLARYYEDIDNFQESSYFFIFKFVGLAQYRWASKLDPKNVRFNVGVIKILMKMKDFVSAKKECKSFIEQQPNLFDLYLILAKIHQSLGDHEEAQNALRKIIKEDKVIIQINDEFLGISSNKESSNSTIKSTTVKKKISKPVIPRIAVSSD